MSSQHTILFLTLLSLVYLAQGQTGCGPQPIPFQFPQPPILPQPCYVNTPPPIIQPMPIPNPAQMPNCKGCPLQWQLPPLIPVPQIYPEMPPGEYLNRPSDRVYVKDTKIIRHELLDDSNTTKSEQQQYDDPEQNHNHNSTFFASPIVPEYASYKHPQYYYSYQNAPQPYGCGIQPTPAPFVLPTPPPLVLPTLPPLQLPQFPPLNNCCGRCSQCPPYYGPKKARAARLFRRDQFSTRCTNKKLQLIMDENRNLTIYDAKLQIQRSAELNLRDGYYHVFCSNQNLEYVSRTESYCTSELVDGVCYAFRTQAFF